LRLLREINVDLLVKDVVRRLKVRAKTTNYDARHVKICKKIFGYTIRKTHHIEAGFNLQQITDVICPGR